MNEAFGLAKPELFMSGPLQRKSADCLLSMSNCLSLHSLQTPFFGIVCTFYLAKDSMTFYL